MAQLSISEFLEYIRAFNNKNYQKQHEFYADDIELVLPDPAVGTLQGSDGIQSHYNLVHSHADETVVPIVVLVGPGNVFLQMETYFKYFRKGKAVHDFDVDIGDIVKICTAALYTVDGQKKFSCIKCYVDTAEKLGKVDLQTQIQESERRASSEIRIYNPKL